MNSYENNETNKSSRVQRLGFRGALAGVIAGGLGFDAFRVLAIAPAYHALSGDTEYNLSSEYIAAGGVEAVIALGAAAYAIKRCRNKSEQ